MQLPKGKDSGRGIWKRRKESEEKLFSEDSPKHRSGQLMVILASQPVHVPPAAAVSAHGSAAPTSNNYYSSKFRREKIDRQKKAAPTERDSDGWGRSGDRVPQSCDRLRGRRDVHPRNIPGRPSPPGPT
ncbi:hypothetical protein Cni_G12131 [Canna indica]|uniref:Uncharacterized protein n=1 Tax=Canna indica TaxID=4628 RepID=A0AAQ3Q8R5_9LILI|nr:hypothetical protein Cni_G12131 [Canna indica]